MQAQINEQGYISRNETLPGEMCSQLCSTHCLQQSLKNSTRNCMQ